MINFSLLAALVIVSLFAVYEAFIIMRLVRANREVEPDGDHPAYDEANAAVIDSIRSSLIDRPEEWDVQPDQLIHESGARVFAQPDGKSIGIEHDGALSIVTGELAERLIEAAQVRNARSLLKALA